MENREWLTISASTAEDRETALKLRKIDLEGCDNLMDGLLPCVVERCSESLVEFCVAELSSADDVQKLLQQCKKITSLSIETLHSLSVINCVSNSKLETLRPRRAHEHAEPPPHTDALG